MRFLSLTKYAASLLFVAGFSLVGVTPALAQDAAPKIAVLDMAAALFNSERAKVVDAQIQEETSEDTGKIQALSEEANGIQTKLQQDAAVMSDDEKRKSAEKLQEIEVQYRFLAEKLQTLRQQRAEEFQNANAQALITAIQAVIEEGGYDLVIRAEAAIHFDEAYNITARVTEKLNTQP